MPPTSNSRPAWASNDDTTPISLAIIVFGLAVFGWLAWTSYHTEISAGFAQAAHWHIRVIRLFTHEYDALGAQLLSADYGRIRPTTILSVASHVGSFFRVPAALLLAGLGVLCFLRAAPARFTRKLDLDGLIREQARTFRTTAAFVERKLGIVAPRAGEPRPADPALHPGEWIERYATAKGGSYDAARARGELARQLGPFWQDVENAAPHVHVLYAVFALHLAQRRPEALALLGDMAEGLAPLEPGEGPAGPERSLTLPTSVVAIADRVLRDPEVAAPARAISARHGYTAPALMSLLTEARRRAGVLAPAQFNGLKLVDRRLWYALHALGFPVEGLGRHPQPNPRVEAIGARDHWAAECAAGGPLLVPSIERAAHAVRAAAGDAAPLTMSPEQS